jgi:hypothetical protein
MPVKSEYAQAMEAVVASTAPLMKKSGSPRSDLSNG